MSYHNHNHSHGGNDHGHDHGHDHHGHSHSHNDIEAQYNQHLLRQQDDQEAQDRVVPGEKIVDINNIIKTTAGEDSVIELDEWNMWNAAAVGEFDFLDIALPRFPFLVDRQDDDGQYMLHWVAFHNNIKAATLLLNARGQQVDCVAKKTGQTPLQWACTKGHIPMVNLLIKHGADVNYKDLTGASALIIATQYKEILTAHFMTRRNANVSIADSNGCGPLHWAAYFNVIPLARLYLSLGVDIDGKDNEGFTPLHRAIFGKCEDMSHFLLENGCDATVKNRAGQTAGGI